MLIDIDRFNLTDHLATCSDIFTQEFCDGCTNRLADAWLLRRHIIADESMINFYTNTAIERNMFYDGFTAVDPRFLCLAFADLVGIDIGSGDFNFSYMKKYVYRYRDTKYTLHKIEILNSCFKLFYKNDLEPYLGCEQPENLAFVEELAMMVFDEDVENKNYYESDNFIELIQVIEKFKRVFVKYFCGAYLHLDRFKGLYTTVHKFNNIRKTNFNNYRLTASMAKKISGAKEYVESDILKPNLSGMLLVTDVQSMIGHLDLKLTDKMKEAHDYIYESFAIYKGIFDRYDSIRGTIQGDVMRDMLVTIALNFCNEGGKQFDHDFEHEKT